MVPMRSTSLLGRHVVLAAVAAVLMVPAAAPAVSYRDSIAAVFNDLGVLGALRGDWSGARVHLDSAALYSPSNPIILNNLGNYFLCQGQIDSALLQFRQALSLDSTFGAPAYNWAVATYLAGRTDEAVNRMEQVLDYIPNDPGLRSVIKVELEDAQITKGDPSKLSQLEITRLLDLAKARRDSALVRGQEVVSATDSLAASAKIPSDKEEITPAGGKAAPAKDLAASLYWTTYAAAAASKTD